MGFVGGRRDSSQNRDCSALPQTSRIFAAPSPPRPTSQDRRLGSSISAVRRSDPLPSNTANRPSAFLITSTSSCRASAVSDETPDFSRIVRIARSARFS